MIELKKLRILSDFKNLKGIDVDYKQGVATYVLIGNNGSGKSSILEALSAIFGSLYNPVESTGFDYALIYSVDERKVAVTHKNGTLKVKVEGRDITAEELRKTFLPSRIICNYSGEDMRIKELYYKRPFDEYIKRLIDARGDNDLRMVFIGKEQWQLILLVMMSCRNQNRSMDRFIRDTLGVNSIDAVRIVIDEKQLAAWPSNPTVNYARQLLNRRNADGTIEIGQINPNEDTPLTLFNIWNGLTPLIRSLEITFNGGVNAGLLSEGEKKLMVVLFMLEAIADEKSIMLLDEPDSHVHVARKAELKTFFDNTVNRKNILTSHSPTLTAKFPQEAIIMLDRQQDGRAVVVDKSKQQIVSELTNNIWTLQEQNIFLASNKTVLVVEGKTDEQILEAALKSLQRSGRYGSMDFSYLPCGGASNVPVLAAKFSPKKNQMMIAFFDADRAGWSAINTVFGTPNKYNSKNFGKARKQGDIWYSAYPPCKRVSNFNLEDYFPRPVFLRYVMSFKSLKDICTEKNLKDNLAADSQAGKITDKQFEKFSYVFDRIQDILDADARGQTEI